MSYRLTEKEKEVVRSLNEFNSRYADHEGLGVILGDGLVKRTGKRKDGKEVTLLTSYHDSELLDIAYVIPPHSKRFRDYLDKSVGKDLLYGDKEGLLDYYYKFSTGNDDDKSADGALVFDRETGELIGHSFAVMKLDPLHIETNEGDGTRHSALASVSLYDNILALALSHEKHRVTAYKHGKMVPLNL